MSSTDADEDSGLRARVFVERSGFTLDVELAIPPGQVVCVLGPNGAGKSTLLSVLAGLLPVSAGRVVLDGMVFDEPRAHRFVPPERRPVGVMFQDYRLFPRQSAVDNIAFGRRARGVPKAIARADALRWLGALGIEHLAGRRPRALSGGQAQRVALARALATNPAMLLMDEPLAALDAQSRRDVQVILRRHLSEFGGPVLVVTHDPVDALLLADRLIVIEDGRIRQDAPPELVAQRPATAYVARLLDLNLYQGSVTAGVLATADGGALTVTGMSDAAEAVAVLRPSAITIHRDQPRDLSARNAWPARVSSLTRLPDRVRVYADGPPAAIVDVTMAAAAELGLSEGIHMWLSAKATDIHSYQPTAASAPPVAEPG